MYVCMYHICYTHLIIFTCNLCTKVANYYYNVIKGYKFSFNYLVQSKTFICVHLFSLERLIGTLIKI